MPIVHRIPLFFFFNDTATTEIYTLSLHDALPICPGRSPVGLGDGFKARGFDGMQPILEDMTGLSIDRPVISSRMRSEEHTSELQSHSDLVCRLLLEKKKKTVC